MEVDLLNGFWDIGRVGPVPEKTTLFDDHCVGVWMLEGSGEESGRGGERKDKGNHDLN